MRVKVSGTATRPRLAVYRSNARIYAQLIDDDAGHTLASASSREKELAATKLANHGLVGETKVLSKRLDEMQIGRASCRERV